MSILKGARVNDALREDDDLLRRETHGGNFVRKFPPNIFVKPAESD